MSEKHRTILTLLCRMTEPVAAKCARGGAAGESRAPASRRSSEVAPPMLAQRAKRLGSTMENKNAQHLPRPCGGANDCCGDTEDAELTVMSGRRERQHVSIRARPDRQARTLMGLFCLPPRVEKATPQTQSNRTKRLYSVLPCGVFPYSVCITLAQTPNPRAPARQK